MATAVHGVVGHCRSLGAVGHAVSGRCSPPQCRRPPSDPERPEDPVIDAAGPAPGSSEESAISWGSSLSGHHGDRREVPATASHRVRGRVRRPPGVRIASGLVRPRVPRRSAGSLFRLHDRHRRRQTASHRVNRRTRSGATVQSAGFGTPPFAKARTRTVHFSQAPGPVGASEGAPIRWMDPIRWCPVPSCSQVPACSPVVARQSSARTNPRFSSLSNPQSS